MSDTMAGMETRASRGSVSVVVVCYRSADDVEACLDAVAAAVAGLKAEVVVVDNGSDDATVDIVRRTHPGVRIADRGVNDGFARGCHVGVELTQGEWLLFVNPDAVVDRNSVQALLAAAVDHPDAGILGGRSVRPDGTTDPRSWWGRPTLWSTLCFATGVSAAFPGHPVLDPESPDRWDGRAREVPVVSGALMLVDRRLWDRLGGFDPRFLLYGEDVDLCLRARSVGWRPRVVPQATFTHAVGASTPGSNRTALVMRGRATVLRRHLRPGTRGLGVALLVAGTGLRAAATSWRQGRRAALTGPAGWQAAWAARGTWSRGWQVGDRLPGAESVQRGRDGTADCRPDVRPQALAKGVDR